MEQEEMQMKRCIDCKKYGVSCNKHSSTTINDYCKNADWKKPTNYERIKNMSIEEMHAFLIELETNRMMFGMAFRNLPETEGLSYNDEIKVWLESEVE